MTSKNKFKPMKTIEHSDTEKENKGRTRHHTQPRNFQSHFGLTGDYINNTKATKQDTFSQRVNSSKNSHLKQNEKLRTLRREISHEPYRSNIPYSTPSKHENKINLNNTKRKSSGVQAANNVLASIPSANKHFMKSGSGLKTENMELQGFTIKPDSKYTSLAEVHQRGFLPRGNYYINKHSGNNK